MAAYAHLFTICAAALYDVAFAATAGMLLCRLWLGNLDEDRLWKKLQRWLVLAVLAMLLAIPAQMFLLAISMTGGDSLHLAWSALPDVIAAHAGHALALSVSVVPILLATAFVSSRSGYLTWMQLALLFAVTVCRSAYGHAASDGDFTLRELAQLLHLTSIAVWAGGVLVAGLLIVPDLATHKQQDRLVAFGNRLSNAVTLALAVIILSGIYNAWQALGHALRPLTHSAWGITLLVKSAVVLLTFAHGARCRLLLQPNASPARPRTLARWMRSEAILMLCVLVLSAWLANLSPADA